MNKKHLITLVILTLSSCAPGRVVGPPPPSSAPPIVAREDQPYYTHGPSYVEHGRRHVWVAGHWDHRHGENVWIHGYYKWYVGIGD